MAQWTDLPSEVQLAVLARLREADLAQLSFVLRAFARAAYDGT